jgi:hypothetical protein
VETTRWFRAASYWRENRFGTRCAFGGFYTVYITAIHRYQSSSLADPTGTPVVPVKISRNYVTFFVVLSFMETQWQLWRFNGSYSVRSGVGRCDRLVKGGVCSR